MHLRIDQKQEKGSKLLIKTKCGKTAGMTLANTTIWYSDVECVDCRPYRFLDVEPGVKRMFRVDGQTDPDIPSRPLGVADDTTPKTRVLRRRSQRK